MSGKVSYPMIDCHVHVWGGISEIDGLIEIADAVGLRAQAVMCIAACGYEGIGPLQTPLGLLFKAMHPERIFCFGALNYLAPNAKESGDVLAGQARRMIEAGADGIKMLEGKPVFRKAIGLPLDSAKYDAFFECVQSSGTPLLYHVADPERLWDPAQASEGGRKSRWFYGDGTYASKVQLYREAEGFLVKFPALRVVFAHFFFMSADLQRAARVLDTYPGVNFDLTPGREMYTNFRKDLAAWRDFFIKYQDRILFGTDSSGGNGGYDAGRVKECQGKVAWMRQFLETENDGINLPPDVLEKTYAGNFQRLVSSSPKPLNLELALGICEEALAVAKAAAQPEAEVLEETVGKMRDLSG